LAEEVEPRLTADTQNQIVLAARNGDVESLGILYQRYYSAMVWLAYSVLLDREQAEDIAQETFTVVCSKLIHLKKPERFAGWLATICRHLAMDALRRTKKRTVALDETAVCASQTKHDDHQALHQAISTLPQMHREIVLLHYFNHMSYQQLGLALGISIHAVKGRLCRARKKISAYLKNNGFE
jgi:RNA polymerase sigma-70 factor (ECF subfamily)